MPPKINAEKCTGSGECVNVCPASVLEVKNGKAVVVNPDQCLECRACEQMCPNKAISFEE